MQIKIKRWYNEDDILVQKSIKVDRQPEKIIYTAAPEIYIGHIRCEKETVLVTPKMYAQMTNTLSVEPPVCLLN